MKLVRCKKCKKMYEHISINNKYCPDCTKREHDRYINVRTYVKNNPGITVQRVSEDLGIDTSIIVRYLKEEKLEISGEVSGFLKCSVCGEEIRTGTHCQSCKRTAGSTATSQSTNVDDSGKSSGMMFTAKNKKK